MSVIQALLLCCSGLLLCYSSDAAIITRSVKDNSTAMHPLESPEQQTTTSSPTSTLPSSVSQCPPGGGTTNGTLVLQYLKQARLATIRAQILAKFGLTDPPDNSGTRELTDIDEESMATYYKFMMAPRQGMSGEEEECSNIKGEKSTFYAKELRLHFPSAYRPVIPSVETFEWGENIRVLA